MRRVAFSGASVGDLLEDRLGILVAGPEPFEVQARETAEPADLDRGRGRDDAVHRGGHHRQLELERVELPGDVDVLGIAVRRLGHDRDVVEPVGPPSGLADPDLDFHVPSAGPCPLEPLRLSLAPCHLSHRRPRDAQKTVENPGRRAPDGLVGELEEVHLELEAATGPGLPPLGVMDTGREQLRERDVEDPDDLAWVGPQLRAAPRAARRTA